MLYILLPVHNRKQITQRFIECLCNQSYTSFHLLLIDDGSTDGTDEMVKALIDPLKITVIKGNGNWWWSGCLQQALNKLKNDNITDSDTVLIINDDVVFETDFLENGVNFIANNPSALLLARFFDENLGKIIETGVTADFKSLSFKVAESQNDINCLSTRGLFLRWNIIKDIGGFRPFLLPHYGSDYEFTIRAGRLGYHLRTNPDVYIIPDHTATGITKADEITNYKILFSKKCVMNPIYWTTFILLLSPIHLIPINIAKIWYRTIRIILIR